MRELPPDHQERQAIIDPQQSFHLEAPAGSGKTSVLLARFLSLLKVVDSPEELLALTFTRKAAGELRTRVLEYLTPSRDIPADAPDFEQELHELAFEVFRHFDRRNASPHQFLSAARLPIMTFHSFCLQLLRLAPHEAGLPLNLTIAEEVELRWLRQETLEDLRRRLAARPGGDPVRQALVRRLVRLNNNWPRLSGELQDLLARRDSLAEFWGLARASQDEAACQELLAQRLELLLAHDLAEVSAHLENSPLGAAWGDFYDYLAGSQAPAVQQLSRRPPAAALKDLPAWQGLARLALTQKGELRKKFTAKEGVPKDFLHSPWWDLLASLPQPFWQKLHSYQGLPSTLLLSSEVTALQDLILLLGAALQIFSEICRRQGVLDFVGLEQAALRLLKLEQPQDLLLRLDRKLQHLLVDEFQDTSENQMTLLCRLLAGWEADHGRTLVVVGDPRQSIYAWRQARLRLFLEARRSLPCYEEGTAVPLTPLTLTTNFRSSRRLITWVNEVFGKTVMSRPEELEGMEFHPAQPAPTAPAGQWPTLSLFVSQDKDQTHQARQQEARWLAREVAKAQEELPDKEKIAILLFFRTHITTYLQALGEAGVLVRVRQGLKLSDSPAVQHLHNLVEALARPHSQVPWAAVLGGPWGEPSLARLIQVAHTPGDFWPEKILHQAAASPGGHRWPQLALALEEILAQVGRLPLAGLVHQFLAETGAWSDLAAWEGAAGVANARTYLELLAQAETGVPESTYRKVDLALQEAYQPPDPQAQASRVEMLTVHGVKGLEYHQVFLPFVDWQPLLGGGKQNPPFILEEISASRQHGLALAPPFWQEQPSLLYRSLKNLRDKKLLAEARRLFYVAVTRAKEKLFLSAVVKLRNQGQWQLPEKSPLAWLWEHYRGPEEFQGSALWADPELRVEVWEEYAAPAPESRPVQEPPPAWEFEPERAPYELRFPSQLAGTPAEIGDWGVTGPQNGGPLPSLSATQPVGDAAPIGAPPSPDALTLMDFHRHLPRLRGELTHRLLETLAQGEALPDIAAVAAALRGYAVDQELAAGLAAEILTEVQACAADPVLAPLLSPAAPTALSEWRLEDQPAPGIIRRGQLDRLVFHGHQWWLLDYKTSRPGPQDDWENFMAWEAAAYRPQLLAYRDLAAKAKGLAPAKINLALYFTGCRKMLILG